MIAQITIREYNGPDSDTILQLLRLNTPAFFAPEEEKDLLHYLQNEIEHYYVIEADGKIVGSGGLNFDHHGTTGKMSWDMIHPLFQGQGLGGRLLQFRIEKVLQDPKVRQLNVRTSQYAHAFYAKFGFRLVSVEKDYWAKGYDLYHMQYEMAHADILP